MTLREAVYRLTTPRPFEPDYARHLARLVEDEKALAVVASAGYATDHAALVELRRNFS
jgi:hypothetical protein